MTLEIRISDQNAAALDERLARLRELDECTRGTDDPGLRQWRLAMADEVAAIAGLSQIKPDYWVLNRLDELLARAWRHG